MEEQRPRVTVLGVGNPLVGDEGVGPRAIEEMLRVLDFPPEVTVLDAGTMGMSILGLIRDADYLLVVDAVDGTGHEPGTVVLLGPEDLASNQVLHSLHDMRLVDVLQAAELIGARPEADFVGIQVAEMRVGTLDLSPAVEAAIPDAIAAAVTLLHGRCAPPKLRAGEPVSDRIVAALSGNAPTG